MLLKTLVIATTTLLTFTIPNHQWLTFNCVKHNYTVLYPDEWELAEPMEGLYAFLSPTKSETDFRENVNFVVQDLSATPNITLKEYADMSVGEVKKFEGTIEGGTYTNTTLSGMDALQLVFESNKVVDNTLKFKQVFLINNGKAYVATYTAAKPDYDTYLVDANQIINSFKLK